MGRLDGKVAIVTGAATGLGRETAVLYAEEGAKVVVADVRRDEAQATVGRIRAAGGEATFIATDVSDRDAVRALVEATEEHHGGLHVMTANAGILGRGAGKSLEDITEEEIEQTMAVNFGGVARCFKYAIPLIRRSGGGAMTATASLSAHLSLIHI